MKRPASRLESRVAPDAGRGHDGRVLETAPPPWGTWREALRVCAHRPHLVKTVTVALVVGTILFTINQLDVVVQGKATAVTWLKVSLTFLVPFCVSNYGILVATRRRGRGA